MALQASIRQLKDVVNEIFFGVCVCVFVRWSPARRPRVRDQKGSSEGNKRTQIFQTGYNRGYFFPPHRPMAAAFLISTHLRL